MDDEKKKKEETLSRRSFLTSLGKWSSIVVATAVLGISEASGSDEGPSESLEPGSTREGIPNQEAAPDESTESQYWRCRVWGNGGGRGWRRRCRVWGNGGVRRCRVWGNW
ncbi:MAG: hypothetical protein WBG50_02960 [Desulfomonilaceae bacterium]